MDSIEVTEASESDVRLTLAANINPTRSIHKLLYVPEERHGFDTWLLHRLTTQKLSENATGAWHHGFGWYGP